MDKFFVFLLEGETLIDGTLKELLLVAYDFIKER